MYLPRKFKFVNEYDIAQNLVPELDIELKKLKSHSLGNGSLIVISKVFHWILGPDFLPHLILESTHYLTLYYLIFSVFFILLLWVGEKLKSTYGATSLPNQERNDLPKPMYSWKTLFWINYIKPGVQTTFFWWIISFC